ncbi:Hint domain-containing protein [Aliiruegeria sabulilitoris]|uniref:Hint domain-containing protein n=1 Tax=Aliiruegeria sabulilitoris TaxID=1510458 RepID=UPI000833C76F|nr:Hint domain-containing protein [Aliiruegeria sabulilitoris]NDR58306.1 hypothetical protein [Pseudoruegeria sp. M32A2M]
MENISGKAFARARPVNAARTAPRPFVLTAEARIDIPDMPLLPGAWLQSAIAAEARVMTPQGPKPAGQLQTGDLILTVDKGALPLRWIGKRALSPTQMAEMPEIGPVTVPRNALAGGSPRMDIRLSPLAGLLLTLPGGPKSGVLIEAREMIGLLGIKPAPARAVTYVQLMTEEHALIAVDGLAVETLHANALRPLPGNSRQRAEVLAQFPDLEHGLDLYGPEIRPRAERRR